MKKQFIELCIQCFAIFLVILLMALVTAFLWLFLIVPLGFAALNLRQSLGIFIFINYFFMYQHIAKTISERGNRLIVFIISTFIYLLLSYIYSKILL